MIIKENKTITLEQQAEDLLNVYKDDKLILQEKIDIITLIKNNCINLFWSQIEW